MLAAALLTLPLSWVVAWAAAMLVHELGHYYSLRLMRIPVHSVTVTHRGILMETGCLPPRAELLAALAGPLGALTLLTGARFFPELAVCACVHSLYNLLPVFPLDGGRALRCVLTKLPASVGECVRQTVEWLVLLLGLTAGFWGTLFMKLGLLPLAGALCLFLRAECVKTPCKERKLRVQ